MLKARESEKVPPVGGQPASQQQVFGLRVPSTASPLGPAPPSAAPHRPSASCLFTDRSPLSADSTHRKSGWEGPIPIPIYTGTEHKKPPFLAPGGTSLPQVHRPHGRDESTVPMAETEAPADGTGRRPRELPQGGRRGVGPNPGLRGQQWWPWPSPARGGTRGCQGPPGQEGAPVQPPVSPPFLYLLCTKVGLIRMPPELKAPLPMNLQDAHPAPQALQSFPSGVSGPPGNRHTEAEGPLDVTVTKAVR
ncbi:hypothetical protein J1605_017285 [Eschrichtius robustus]|uniref:Uncharacterized protein n=1 Tax=Eschrichtius robustus TaxID=9764 RepID=A0AB34HZM4_ESCRO|nr:hypothetical protein J1605_017285 [Eschrichtius robustus]